MVAVGKHLGLVRQVSAAGIDQIDAGQPVLARDLLGAQMLLHRHRIVGAALHGRIVADDHDEAAGDAPDAGDQAGAVDRLAVHLIRRQRRQLEERRAGIEQAGDALAGQQLSAREMTLARTLRPAERNLGAPLLQRSDEPAPRFRIALDPRRIDRRGFQDGHRVSR